MDIDMTPSRDGYKAIRERLAYGIKDRLDFAAKALALETDDEIIEFVRDNMERVLENVISHENRLANEMNESVVEIDVYLASSCGTD